MADNYIELQIKINPEIEDIMSDFFFENLPCEGVILAEETYKDLEMVSTTEGILKVFLRHSERSEESLFVVHLQCRQESQKISPQNDNYNSRYSPILRNFSYL